MQSRWRRRKCRTANRGTRADQGRGAGQRSIEAPAQDPRQGNGRGGAADRPLGRPRGARRRSAQEPQYPVRLALRAIRQGCARSGRRPAGLRDRERQAQDEPGCTSRKRSMRKSLLLAPALLAACATASRPRATPVHGVTPGHKCEADGTDRFIGQTGSRADRRRRQARDECGGAALGAAEHDADDGLSRGPRDRLARTQTRRSPRSAAARPLRRSSALRSARAGSSAATAARARRWRSGRPPRPPARPSNNRGAAARS